MTTTAVVELPVGTPVRYWTGFREGDGKASRTRTTAQPLGGEGEVSCISVTHVQEITEEELQAAIEAQEDAVCR